MHNFFFFKAEWRGRNQLYSSKCQCCEREKFWIYSRLKEVKEIRQLNAISDHNLDPVVEEKGVLLQRTFLGQLIK